MRLDKFLADRNLGTRSEVKQYIRNQRVVVNGTLIKDPGHKIRAESDQILLDNKKISYVKHKYYMFHKPAGCITANKDSFHQTVMDYFKEPAVKGLFPAGRLDRDTEGLLLITNDGAFAHELFSPAKHVTKTYYVRLDGRVTEYHCQEFQKGLAIGEKKPLREARLTILKSGSESEVYVTIQEGRFHQIKRMFQVFDLKVLYLKRIEIGGVFLDEKLPPGEYRELSDEEYRLLLSLRQNSNS